jgi:hypothetical protein
MGLLLIDVEDELLGMSIIDASIYIPERLIREVERRALLRWNGMRWEPKRAVNNQLMNALKARISRLQPWRVSTVKSIGINEVLILHLSKSPSNILSLS